MSAKELELLNAAASGDFTAVQSIITSKKISNLNYQNEDGASALHLAAMNGHRAIVEILIKSNLNKELKDLETGETALHKSAFHGQSEVLQLLLQKGADKEARSKNNSTALHLAAQAGHEASVQYLLSYQAAVDPIDSQGYTPLMHAAMYGHMNIVLALLEHSSDLNRTNLEGQSALHLSCEKDQKQTAQLLLTWGAEIELGDKNGLTPLMCAARAGHASIVDLLLTSGAKVDAECQAGMSAMMHAVKANQLASAELLLNKGANPHYRDKNECTAIQLAVECGFYELTELLIERDADKAVLTQAGQSLLMLAAMNGHTDIVALLVKEEGQDVNCVNPVDGNTALHYASLTGQSETVKFLLTLCHAETNIVNKENNSARALALNAETREVFPPGTGTSFFGKVKGALSGIFGMPTSAPAESTSTTVRSDSNAVRKRHQRLLREGQHLLARREWIKRRDLLHAELQTAMKSSGYKEAQTRQQALDEHERTSSRIGIRESRYYTFPARLLQSLSDLEGITLDVSAMAPSAVAAALDTRLQVLSQQRAGTDGIPLHNALTDKNYTVEELFLEISVLQQALNVPSLDLSTPIDSLLRGHRLAFENEIQELLNQLALEGVHTIEFEELTNNASSASAQGVADRSVESSRGAKTQQSAIRNKAVRSYTAGEMASEIAELKLLFKNVSTNGPPGASPVVNPLTAEPYTLFDVLDRAQNLRYALYDDNIISSGLSASSESDKAEAQAVLHYNNTLHQLVSRIQKECPSLVWFYPKTSMFWLGDPAKHLLEDSVMMVFVCPVTLKVIKCGPQGTGWEVRAPKEFLKTVMPALLLSLFVMQAAVLEGREVQIPLSWQYSPVSVADEMIPSKLVKTALTERFEADHCMRCLAAFTEGVKSLADLSDPSLKLLCLKLSLQRDCYKQTHLRSTSSTYPKITLGTEFTPKMFEETYKTIHSFLTTGENAKLGKLEDQLRGSMERVMAEDGDIEWVGLDAGWDWLQMHAQCVNVESVGQKVGASPPAKSLSDRKVFADSIVPLSGNSWLATTLRGKGVSNELILNCVQKLVEGEDFSTEEVFAQMSPEDFNLSYLRAIGITNPSAQETLISAHKEAVARYSVSSASPAADNVDETEIQRKLQAIYEEFASQKQITAAARLARDGRIRPVSVGGGTRSTDSSSVPSTPGPSADGSNDGDDNPGSGSGGHTGSPCCPCGADMTLIASGKGHFSCLRYAIDQGFPIHTDACTAAAAGNFVACLDLLRKNDAPWSAETTRAAAIYGSFDALCYLQENDCDYDDDLLVCAAEGGCRNCVRYLVEDRFLRMNGIVFGAAFERAHVECVLFFLDSGCPIHDYGFRGEDEWYLCRGYHKACNVDERFLRCILWAVDRGWRLNDNGEFECPNLVRYILDNPNIFPLCRAHVILEGWQA